MCQSEFGVGTLYTLLLIDVLHLLDVPMGSITRNAFRTLCLETIIPEALRYESIICNFFC